MSIEIRRPDIEECRKNREREREDCCVCRQVRFIDKLQRKFASDCCISCDAPQLGMNVPGVNSFNTRPFILFLENGEPFAIAPDPVTAPGTTTTIFRVESVDGDCCAVLRAIVIMNGVFIGTNACVTVDLCEFIGIQCLPDVFIGCTPVMANGAA